MTDPNPNPRTRLIAVPDGAPDDFDSFALHDPTYSPDEFYTKASDGGFSGRMPRATVPPAIAAKVNEIVQDRRLPYRTIEDFQRDAYFHRLHYLAERHFPDKIHPLLNMWARAHFLAANKARLDENRDYLSSLHETASRASKDRNFPVLASILDDALDAADAEPEPHRSEILEIVRRFQPDVDRWRRVGDDDA